MRTSPNLTNYTHSKGKGKKNYNYSNLQLKKYLGFKPTTYETQANNFKALNLI